MITLIYIYILYYLVSIPVIWIGQLVIMLGLSYRPATAREPDIAPACSIFFFFTFKRGFPPF